MRLLARTLLPILLAGAAAYACADDLPPIKKLRFEEDYSGLLARPAHSWPGCWKAMPLDTESTGYISIGGEIRQRYEYTNNPTFGQDPQDKHGVWFQRYALLADLHWNEHFRLFGQLNSALETGRREDPSPVDEDQMSWQNLFAEFSADSGEKRSLALRAGRQEIVLGSGRLVDVREGPNVRRTFDGARAFLRNPRWRLDLLATRPREDNPGVFDDGANNRFALWGAYATLPAFGYLGSIDVYYLGFQDEDAQFVQGEGREQRHSFGTRVWGNQNNWGWNWEALYQTGSFADGDIDAWTLATETSYRWNNLPWKPELRVSINIASGDDNPDDPDLGTFNPLFPRGNYFSEAAVFGPRNFYNFHTFINAQPSEPWSLTADLNFFWRLETQDGLYSPSGQIIRAPNGSVAHFSASALSLTAEYTIYRGLVLTAIHTVGKPEKFLEETGAHEILNFTELTMQYRF
ncbi:alginate export family protein [Microbulbifer sp. SA54]|uniref:alginate export family protein n=1 Tax=Microbulbifer sp. SA54 TaxID=3401577 RepID=UPI003AAFA10D